MSDAQFGGSGQRSGTVSESKPVMQQVTGFADDLKKQASGLATTAGRQIKGQAEQFADTAKDAVSGAGERLSSLAEEKKNDGADLIGGLAGAVRRAAGAFDDQLPQASDYIRRAAEQIDGASEALRQRDVNELVNGIQDFARRQPTAFLGITVLAGFAAVRFLKSSTPERNAGPAYGRGGSMPTPQSENARRMAGVADGMRADWGA